MTKSQTLVPYVHVDGEKWQGYFVDVSSKIIYYRAKHAGRRIVFSTLETVGVKARKVVAKELPARIGGKARRSYAMPSIGELVPAWLEFKESEGLAYDTMNNVRRAAAQIAEFWENLLPDEITREKIVEWKRFWKEKHPDIYMENALKYFKNLCRYLGEEKWNDRPLLAIVPIITDPDAKEIRRRRQKKKERVITPDEFAKIRATAPDSEAELVVMIMYTMATRIQETLSLAFDDTILMDEDLPLYRWRYGQNKAGLDGEHALHPSVVDRLRFLRARRSAEGTTRLFPQLRDNSKPLLAPQIDWISWKERAALGWNWTPHTFRHTCLTNLFNDARNPQLIICKLYRVSLQVALETYVKVQKHSVLQMRAVIEVPA